jgi:hypothetical protein
MKPGRHADGNGLYLVVDPSGAKRWVLRVVIRGHGRTDIGLGGLGVVDIIQAREEAARLRGIARAGGNPLVKRQLDAKSVPSFEKSARTVHESHKKGWRNEKHAQQWIRTLEEYVFPVLGFP